MSYKYHLMVLDNFVFVISEIHCNSEVTRFSQSDEASPSTCEFLHGQHFIPAIFFHCVHCNPCSSYCCNSSPLMAAQQYSQVPVHDGNPDHEQLSTIQSIGPILHIYKKSIQSTHKAHALVVVLCMLASKVRYRAATCWR